VGIRALLAFALLAGCSSAPTGPLWTHPTKDELEWRGELADCARFFGSSEREQERCMAGKGWKKRGSSRASAS